jgi:hypothetical protein
MNIYTIDVMSLLSVGEELADKILDEMSFGGFDFSESTKHEFDQCAEECYESLITRELEPS